MTEQHSDCLSMLFCMQDGKRGNIFKMTPKYNKIKFLFNKSQSTIPAWHIKLKPDDKKLSLFRSKEYKLQLMSTQEKQFKRLPESQSLHCSLEKHTSAGSPYISHNSSKEARAYSLGGNMKQQLRSNYKLKSHQKTPLTLHAKNQNPKIKINPKIKNILSPKSTQTLDTTFHNFPENKVQWKKQNKVQHRSTNEGESLVNEVKKSLQVVQHLEWGSLHAKLFQEQDQNNSSSVEGQPIWSSKVKRYQFSNSIERIAEESSSDEFERSAGFSRLEVLQLQNKPQFPIQFTLNQEKSNTFFTQTKNRPIKINSLSHHARTIVSNYDTGSRVSRVSESIVIEYPLMRKKNQIEENGMLEQTFNRNFAKRLTYQPEHQQSPEISPRWKTQKNVRFISRQIQPANQTSYNNLEQKSQTLQREGQRYPRPSLQFQLLPVQQSRSNYQQQEERKTQSLIYEEATFSLERYTYNNPESGRVAQRKISDTSVNIERNKKLLQDNQQQRMSIFEVSEHQLSQ